VIPQRIMDCAKAQTNLYVLSLQELSTHWAFCFASLTKILNEPCEAPSIRFSPHPPSAHTTIPAVLKKHYKTVGVAPLAPKCPYFELYNRSIAFRA